MSREDMYKLRTHSLIIFILRGILNTTLFIFPKIYKFGLMFTLLVYTILIISSVAAIDSLHWNISKPHWVKFQYFDLQKASTNAYILKHSNFNIGPQRVIGQAPRAPDSKWSVSIKAYACWDCSCNLHMKSEHESHLPSSKAQTERKHSPKLPHSTRT